MSNRGEEKRNPRKWSKSAVLPVEKDSKTYVKMEKVKKNEAMEEFTNGFGKVRVKKEKKIWTISRFMRVILAQGPC